MPGPRPGRAETQEAQEQAVPVADPAAERPGSATSGPALPSTGDAPVDEALEALVGVLERPLAEQLDVYAGVNRQLQDRLADLDG